MFNKIGKYLFKMVGKHKIGKVASGGLYLL